MMYSTNRHGIQDDSDVGSMFPRIRESKILADFVRRQTTWDVVTRHWMAGSGPWKTIQIIRNHELDVTLAGEIWRKLQEESKS